MNPFITIENISNEEIFGLGNDIYSTKAFTGTDAQFDELIYASLKKGNNPSIYIDCNSVVLRRA